jgi:hypothetical protein
LSGRSKPFSFEEYWRASTAWQSRGLMLASARALTNAGSLTVEDLQSITRLELAVIPRIGAKNLPLLHELKGEKVPDVARHYGKARRLRSILNSGIDGPTNRERRARARQSGHQSRWQPLTMPLVEEFHSRESVGTIQAKINSTLTVDAV